MGPALVLVAGATVTIAVAEVTRHGSIVIAHGSWSKPAGAREVTRRARAISLAGVLIFALVPLLGMLGAVDIESTTAQVESPKQSYLYRIDYGSLQAWIRRSIIIASASSTVAVIAIPLQLAS